MCYNERGDDVYEILNMIYGVYVFIKTCIMGIFNIIISLIGLFSDIPILFAHK